jgi:hypothetical protein
MDNSLASIIDSAASVLILLPQKPTFDSVAAGLSLYLSTYDKKPTTISSSSEIMVGFNRVIGINKVTRELGNKNLTIKFKSYDAANIEKVSYDIIDGEFNLTVVPKTGFVAPSAEQVNMGYAGISADTVILVGGANESDYPELASEELANAKVVHIGNRTFASNKAVISLARPGSSVSEVVAVIIKDNGFTMDPDVATNLLMGIEEGSSNFTGTEVTPATFEIFAHLLRQGGLRQSRVKLSPTGFPPGAIPTQPFNMPPQSLNNSMVQQWAGQMPPAPQAMPGTQMPQMPQETDATDANGTGETEQDINPPDDWLKPKVFTGAQQQPAQQPQAFSENKG